MSDRDIGVNQDIRTGAKEQTLSPVDFDTGPLNKEQVKDEARKLEAIKREIRFGNDEAGALQKWQDEMFELAKHGTNSVYQVKQQMRVDEPGGIDPFLPKVQFSGPENELNTCVKASY